MALPALRRSRARPGVVIMDRLRGYIQPIKALASNAQRRVQKALSIQIEGFPRPDCARKTQSVSNRPAGPKGPWSAEAGTVPFAAPAFPPNPIFGRRDRGDLWSNGAQEMRA